MQDKFNLRLEENIFLAKKQLVENIYCSARVEGLNTTFLETQTILDGVNVPSVTLDDITTILNLRDAWRFILNSVQDEINLDYICKINDFVSRNESLEWGVLRKGNVGISGTDYVPAVPVKEAVENEIAEILKQNTAKTEKALKIFLYIARNQLFWDGNKRTATLAANKILIAGGAGVLRIKENTIFEFNTLLKEFYDTANGDGLMNFLYEKCIFGLFIS